MAVGFSVPPGTRSRANTDHPQAILQQFLPWGDSGNDTRDEFSMPGSPENRRFLETFQRRYGKARPDQPVPDAPGLHHTDYEAALTEIADKNPGWFAQRGFGSATGRTDPSRQEIFDAQYSANIHQQVIDEARRIGLASGPGPGPGPSPGPGPGPGPGPEPGPVTTPDFTVIREDIANLARQVQSARDAALVDERRWWHDRLTKEIAAVEGPGPGQKRAVKELQALMAERPLTIPPQPPPSSPSNGTVADVRKDIENVSKLVESLGTAGKDERNAWQALLAKEITKREGEGRAPAAKELRALAAERPVA